MSQRTAALALAALFALAAGGCREEGRAERAGRELDEAVEKLRHGDEGALERAGRKIDEAVEDVEEAVDEAREDVAEAIEGED